MIVMLTAEDRKTNMQKMTHKNAPVCGCKKKFEGQGTSNRKQNAMPTQKDKSLSGGCIFVDAASGHIKIKFQTHFLTQEAIKTIKLHELKARDNGIVIQEC